MNTVVNPMDGSTRDPETWPLHWFARLEQAVEIGDHAKAAEYCAKLESLGVMVCYGMRPRAHGVKEATQSNLRFEELSK